MDHQIQNNIHIGPALAETAEPVAFNKDRLPDMGPHDLHDRIEPLTVADLETAPLLPGQMDKLVGFCRGHGNRFLHQHVFARRQTGLGDMVMGGCRDCHTDHIHMREKLFDTAEDSNSVAIGDELGSFDRLIGHPDQLGTRQGTVQARMVLPEVPDSNNAGF